MVDFRKLSDISYAKWQRHFAPLNGLEFRKTSLLHALKIKCMKGYTPCGIEFQGR